MSDNKQVKVKEGGSVNLGRHQAQCTVCQHPQRQEIEEAWIGWGYTNHIAKDYGVSRDSIYRHAHALGLFSKRQKNHKLVVEKIMERLDWTEIHGSDILSAIKIYEKIISAEQRIEQAQATNPKELLERMSQEERDAFARDGSLPAWFSKAIGATPDDGQKGEKDSQATETTRVQ